jgi:hypothetical protein
VGWGGGGLLDGVHRGKTGRRLFRESCMARVQIWNLEKQRVVCGDSWLLRVSDHEAAVLLDPNLFSSSVRR